MKSIHVLRKPCSEPTVAANVLKHGTGGINVDGSRIGTTVETWSTSRSYPYGGGVTYGSKAAPTEVTQAAPPGRWPANIVLQHLDGCRQDGVPNTTRNAPDNYGTVTVAAWNCTEGCPVASLPFTVTNSGTLQGDARNGRHIPIAPIRRHETVLSSGNSGGASRFFKQVKS